MLLQNLITGKEHGPCVLVEDDLDHMGRACIKMLVTALSQRYDSVLVLLTELRPEAFLDGLSPHVRSKIHILDATTNPQSWQEATPNATHPQLRLDSDLVGEVLSDRRLAGEVAVVIDTLDDILLHRSVAYTCKTLHRLSHQETDSTSRRSQVQQVVSLVHSDVQSDATLQTLRHMATSSIRMSQPKDAVNYKYACRILHQRASGKVLRSEEQFNVSDDFTLSDIAEVLRLKNTQVADSAPDPTANLTFNLSLSSQEREARSQLVLPYIRKQDKKVENAGSSSAKIFYQPDEADDFDEEDPDDDLDI